MKKIALFFTASLMAAGLYAQDAQKPVGYKLGKYEIYILTESSGQGNTGILIGAPNEVLEKYAPEGTFPNAVNAVLVRSGEEVWIIDTGFGRNIFGKMAALGIRPEDVDHVLLTHMHGDHIGGMFRNGVKAFPNADVTVSRKEFEYWSSVGEMNKMPENRRSNFAAAQKVFADYADKLQIVDPYEIEDEFPEGISPVAAYGHTPGHMMFMLRSGKSRLLVWGDLTHAMAVQMPHPEISVTYDIDPDMARESRIKVLRFLDLRDEDGKEVVVTGYDNYSRVAVIGMHVAAEYPGKVYGGGDTGGYKFREISTRRK